MAMQRAQQFYIDGRWVAPATRARMDVVDPATEERATRIAVGGDSDVDAAVAAARRAFADWSATPVAERRGALLRIAEGYARRSDDIARALMREMGAPWSLARSAQAGSGLQHFRSAAALLEEFAWEEAAGSTLILREPVGVCALITPWNWPMNQIGAKVAPALAAGCTMVLKPSEEAPTCALILAEIIDAAGLPPGVFNLVNGDGRGAGARLSRHPDVDLVSFTGSTRAGIDVATGAAPTVKRVTQELGGKSANVLLDDADFPRAVRAGVRACMHNSGQSCNAPTRLLVPRERLEEVEALAVAALEGLTVGPPGADGTRLGPQVSEAQWRRVQGYLEAGLGEGAHLLAGGPGRPAPCRRGFFSRPTVFSRVDNAMTVAREEIFGPVLAILPYGSEDEAVAIANDSPYGLSGYVSSGDLERARALARRLRTGGVHLNGAPLDPAAPFGGYRRSGNGREWGRFGLEEYLELKSVYGWAPR